MFGLFKKTEIPSAAEALPGRDRPLPLAAPNRVTGRPMRGTGASCVTDPVAADGTPA